MNGWLVALQTVVPVLTPVLLYWQSQNQQKDRQRERDANTERENRENARAERERALAERRKEIEDEFARRERYLTFVTEAHLLGLKMVERGGEHIDTGTFVAVTQDLLLNEDLSVRLLHTIGDIETLIESMLKNYNNPNVVDFDAQMRDLKNQLRGYRYTVKKEVWHQDV